MACYDEVMTTTETPDEKRDRAGRLDQAAHDSFERCDTDGALSQWASQATARKLRAEADLIEAGGVARFTALFTLDGELVPSWDVQTRYGTSLIVKTEWDRDAEHVGFVGYAKQMKTFERKGYRLGVVERPAYVDQVFAFTGSPGTIVLRPDWFTAHTPTVITTGEGLTVDEVWAIRGGADV
jgi:hypothetical protein